MLILFSKLNVKIIKGDDYMTKVGEVYRCKICGNLVEVKESGAGTLVCCGQPMVLEKDKKKKK